jgi:hypothetical protein
MTGSRFPHRLLAAALGFALAAGFASAQTPPAAATPATAPAAAAPVAAKPLWKELTQPQQVALAPLLAEWDQMDTARKQKWLEIANRFASMKPDEQQRAHGRMREWLKLTPEERRLARENYTLSKKIDKSQKSAQWEQYQQLPEEEKRKLAAEAAQKKQVTNLPPKTQPKAVTPIKPVVCAAGTVKNANPAGPACVPAPAVIPPPAAAPLLVPPATTPPPGTPAAPVPNAK